MIVSIKSKDLNLSLKIIHPLINYEYKPKMDFINKQLEQLQILYNKINLDFEIVHKPSYEVIKKIKPASNVYAKEKWLWPSPTTLST